MSRASLVRLSLCAVVVLAIGSALLPSPQPAAAADDTVTTELQPGLNLAGWTEPAASIEAIFDSIPELELVYAWDAQDQWFRWAARTDSGVLGNLHVLTPGMGLWLSITGEEPVTWTRPLVRQTGLASLHAGWNLVAWAGDEGIATPDALQDLNDILTDTADADGAEPAMLTRGGALWLSVTGDREWEQPYDSPRTEDGSSEGTHIEFVTPVSSEREAEVRALVDVVVEYFHDHAGVRLPGLTIRWGDPREFGCSGGYWPADNLITMSDCFDVFPHEYVHAVHEYLAGDEGFPLRWFDEGAADFWAAVYHDDVGERGYIDDLLGLVIPAARRQAFVSGVGYGYESYHLRILFLANTYGPEALFDFARALGKDPDISIAFREAFGFTISNLLSISLSML